MNEEKQIVEAPGLFDSRPRGYAQCVTAGNLVFVAGQVGLDERAQVVSPEFGPQARLALENVRTALEAAGTDLAHITAMTVHLTDMRNLPAFAAAKREVMGDVLATSTAVEVSRLALPELLVEVTAIAVRPGR